MAKPQPPKKSNGRDFNVRLAWLKFSQSGNLTSKPIDKDMYDALQQAEQGGKFFVKMMTKDGEDYAVLEYMSKEKVAEFNASRPAKPQEEEAL